MSKTPKRSNSKKPTASTVKSPPSQNDFDDLLQLIDAARLKTMAAVNTAMIDLYWNIGEHITQKIADNGWGKGTVEALAESIRRRNPNVRVFPQVISGE